MSSRVVIYRLGPFVLASEIPILELTPLEGTESGAADVWIRMGTVPERIDGVVANETRWWASREEYLLRVPGVANFLVRRGREVIVQVAPSAQARDVRAYLLSPIFSTLCHQARMYALHASSVRVGDGVVAFLGNSGAGKSTLAAYLERRGHTVISDDLCLLDLRTPERTEVVPVAPSLKLWRSALEQLGAVPEELPQVFTGDDKYRLQVNELQVRLPLRELLFLEWAEAPETGVSFTPLYGVQAIARVMELTHYNYLMKAQDRQAESFALAGRILSQAGAQVFRRPRSFAAIEGVVDALEEHFAAGMGGAQSRRSI